MRIVFMGTPDFAAAPLESIIKSGKHQVTGVVTQPDKPKGRGKSMQFPPVKEKALEYGIPVWQPDRINTPEMLQILKEQDPDCIVVAAFGQILKKDILMLPQYGCINIHASLLPKLRGAAPIQWAVIQGDEKAGVTTMWMDEGLDTGDMLLKKEVILDPQETGGSLFDKLSLCGCELILETLEALEEGTAVRTPQTGESSYAKILTKELGNIDWTRPAEEIERLIRGLNPWPSAYSYLNGKMVKFWSSAVTERPEQEEPGTILQLNKHSFAVSCGKDWLEIHELQAEGKKRMTADAWLRGVKLEEGMRFTRTRI
ncbi:MAG: methionyl-tRNA formyltransferase [Lachnospiraceae bacterium]|nr:methionyl-tRNA formyltransferase [Lachnospiraceae bacterium]MDY4970667.1 methionyl-tRNA formyltransferase [Lachnospiraceae bacterium]